jgi:hypothetical protein
MTEQQGRPVLVILMDENGSIGVGPQQTVANYVFAMGVLAAAKRAIDKWHDDNARLVVPVGLSLDSLALKGGK